ALERHRAVEVDDRSIFRLVSPGGSIHPVDADVLPASALIAEVHHESAVGPAIDLQVSMDGSVALDELADPKGIAVAEIFLPDLGQIAVAVVIHIQILAVLDQPDARIRLLAEDQKAVARLGLVNGFLENGAWNAAQIGGPEQPPAAENNQAGQDTARKHGSPPPVLGSGSVKVPHNY